MAQTQIGKSRLTVLCPFTKTETHLQEFQQTDHLCGLGLGVLHWCDDCQMEHYHLVR